MTIAQSSGETTSHTITLACPAYSATTSYTMTVNYNLNGGEIPDSPHKHTSTEIFQNQGNAVYMATSINGTFSRCEYAISSTLAYPNH